MHLDFCLKTLSLVMKFVVMRLIGSMACNNWCLLSPRLLTPILATNYRWPSMKTQRLSAFKTIALKSFFDNRPTTRNMPPVPPILDIFRIRMGTCRADGSISAYEEVNKLEIPTLRPFLQLRQPLDREKFSEYRFKLIAEDGKSGFPPDTFAQSLHSMDSQSKVQSHSASMLIAVRVADVNDHAPEVEPSLELKISEDSPIGTQLAQITAKDQDVGDNAKIRYSLREIDAQSEIGSSPRFPFGIDPHTGLISVVNPLDADALPSESHGIMEFLVISADSGMETVFSSTTSIRVQVIDVNDEAPQIKVVDLASRSNPARPAVRENLPPGALVAFVTVTDADAGINGMVTCSLDNSNFALEPVQFGSILASSPTSSMSQDGQLAAPTTSQFGELSEKELRLITKVSLDREDNPTQPVTIICVDHAEPKALAKTSHQRLLVAVLDENDNDPQFPLDFIEVAIYENSPQGEVLLKLNATDADETVVQQLDWGKPDRSSGRPQTSNLVHELDEKGACYFKVDPFTGVIYSRQSFDREEFKSLEFTVTVKDHGTPQRSATARVVVTILDRNDNAPVFTQSEYVASVSESLPIGTTILQFLAHDKDEGDNAKFTYHLEDLRGLVQRQFALDSRSGNLTIRAELDREVESHYSFQVYAVDRGIPRQTSFCRVKITVMDVNDNAPKFVYPTQNNHTLHFSSWNSPDLPLVKLTAVDKDEGANAEQVFLIAEGNENGIFQLDPQTGDLRIKPGLDLTSIQGRYQLKLQVRDNGSPPLSGFAHITVVLDSAALLAPTPQGSPKSADSSTGRTLAVTRTDPDRSIAQSPKDKVESPTDSGTHGHVRTGGQNVAETGNQEWETESYFGNEHTLILIICLSAIATMLAFIIFVMITWLRRRNRSQDIVRSLDYDRQRNLDNTMKRVFVDTAKSPPYRSSTILQQMVPWEEQRLENFSKDVLGLGTEKRDSPVYWLRTGPGTKLQEVAIQAKSPTNTDRNVSMVTNSRSSDCLAEDNSIMLEPMAFHDNHIIGGPGTEGHRERGGGGGPNGSVYAAGIGKILPYSRAPALVMAYSQVADASRLQGDCLPSSISSENTQGTAARHMADSPTTSVYQPLIHSTHQTVRQVRNIESTQSGGSRWDANVYRTLCRSLPAPGNQSTAFAELSTEIASKEVTNSKIRAAHCRSQRPTANSPQYTFLDAAKNAYALSSPQRKTVNLNPTLGKPKEARGRQEEGLEPSNARDPFPSRDSLLIHKDPDPSLFPNLPSSFV
uniref:Cadherin domain-containing protein n=1 Tax=Schistocephalus solidus TaxID=70667 RepID=A0A0X3P734_SCHSO